MPDALNINSSGSTGNITGLGFDITKSSVQNVGGRDYTVQVIRSFVDPDAETLVRVTDNNAPDAGGYVYGQSGEFKYWNPKKEIGGPGDMAAEFAVAAGVVFGGLGAAGMLTGGAAAGGAAAGGELGGAAALGETGAIASPVYGGSAVGVALPPASAAGSAGGLSWSTVGSGLSAAKTASGFLSGKATVDASAARTAASSRVPLAPVTASPGIGQPQIIAVRTPQEIPAQAREVEIPVPVLQSTVTSAEKESPWAIFLAIAGAFAAAKLFGG